MKEQIDQYVEDNPLTQKEILFEGPGYKVVLVPEDFFDSQPAEFRHDPKTGTDKDRCMSRSRDEESEENYDWWYCTRKRGHPGPHVAGFDTNAILQVW